MHENERIRFMAWAAMLAVTASCASSGIGERHHPSGRPAAQGPLVDGMQEGLWTFWTATGTLEARGEYRRDERIGEWTHYYEDGRPRMRGSYADGRQQGLWEYWHEGGELQCRGTFVDGREHGEWTFWHRNGQLAQRGCFVRGQRQLRWQEWDDAGQLLAVGPFLDDVAADRWQRRGTDGAEQSLAYPTPAGTEWICETWPDGAVRREGFCRQGRPHGAWLTRHPGGAPRALVEFVDGEPVGELRLFDGAGALLAMGPLQRGEPGGDWLVADAQGVLTAAGPLPAKTPWDRDWAAAATGAPLTLVHRRFAELRAPLEPTAVAVVPTPPVAEAAASPPAPPERLEAPTDPGQWTLRERAELAVYRRYLRDGWLPRNGSLQSRYGAGPDAPRLGKGDAAVAGATLGKPLPIQAFAAGTGGEVDLGALRGKRVLFVVLRGFKTQVCPYCYVQTGELVRIAGALAEADCEIVVMFPGSRSQMEAFVQACRDEFGDGSPPYRIVFDRDLALARALGLQGDMARPATFVLDRAGIVQWAYVSESVENTADRPNTDELLRAVRATK